jgi:hypothetical protein
MNVSLQAFTATGPRLAEFKLTQAFPSLKGTNPHTESSSLPLFLCLNNEIGPFCNELAIYHTSVEKFVFVSFFLFLLNQMGQ